MRTTIFGEELMKAATDVELVIQYGEKQSNRARIYAASQLFAFSLQNKCTDKNKTIKNWFKLSKRKLFSANLWRTA